MEPLVVGLLGITHPHASARVRALRAIKGRDALAVARTIDACYRSEKEQGASVEVDPARIQKAELAS